MKFITGSIKTAVCEGILCPD